MELVIQARNLELSPQVRAYVEKKLERIRRRLNNTRLLEANLELAHQDTRAADHRVVAQMTLNCNGTLLRGEERAATAQAAVDAVLDVMDRRVAHYKAKLHRGKIGGKAARGPEAPPEEVVTPPSPPLVTTFELPSGTIVRRKRFAMQPMPPEEAATHMELLGHEFFLFLNSTTGQFNVLYRRRDGDYGLIEPEPE